MKAYKDIVGDSGSRIVEQVTNKNARLNERMKGIRYKVAVMSGKGGVGKSTLTIGLAVGMAKDGIKVGIMDADINGPSIQNMMGIEDVNLDSNEMGITPVNSVLGIKVMSMNLLLPSKVIPTRWDGPSITYPWISAIEATALRELLADTNWGELDILLIDMPPGLNCFNDLAALLPDLSGVIIVTIPSEISHLIVLKTVYRIKELNVPIIGIIENMKGYTCIHCGKENDLFSERDMEEVFAYLNLPYLGRVPFDKGLSLSDGGLTRLYKEGSNIMSEEIFAKINKEVLRRLK